MPLIERSSKQESALIRQRHKINLGFAYCKSARTILPGHLVYTIVSMHIYYQTVVLLRIYRYYHTSKPDLVRNGEAELTFAHRQFYEQHMGVQRNLAFLQ